MTWHKIFEQDGLAFEGHVFETSFHEGFLELEIIGDAHKMLLTFLIIILFKILLCLNFSGIH